MGGDRFDSRKLSPHTGLDFGTSHISLEDFLIPQKAPNKNRNLKAPLGRDYTDPRPSHHRLRLPGAHCVGASASSRSLSSSRICGGGVVVRNGRRNGRGPAERSTVVRRTPGCSCGQCARHRSPSIPRRPPRRSPHSGRRVHLHLMTHPAHPWGKLHVMSRVSSKYPKLRKMIEPNDKIG